MARNARFQRLIAGGILALTVAASTPSPAGAIDPNQPLSYWQGRFDQYIGPMGSDLSPTMRALRYASFYRTVALARPDELVWAGAASTVVWSLATMLAIRAVGAIPGTPTAGVVNAMAAGPWDMALTALADANRAVAHEMGPLHVAYLEGGIAAIHALHDRHEIPDDIDAAFTQIHAGGVLIHSGTGDRAQGQSTVLAGSAVLMHHEQYGAVEQLAFGRYPAVWDVVAPPLGIGVKLLFGPDLPLPYGLVHPAERTVLGENLMQRWQHNHEGTDERPSPRPVDLFDRTDTSPRVPPPGGPGGGSSAGGVDLGRVATIDYLATPEGLGKDALAFVLGGLPGSPAGSPADVLQAGSLAGGALLDFLVLDPDETYVNLNPDQPDDVVPPGFRSLAGLVSLAADRELKRTVAGLVDPATPFGAQWWDGAGPSSGGCSSSRMWITLAPSARVWTNGNASLVLDAPLRVQLEGEDLHLNPSVGLSGETCRPDPAEVTRTTEQLLPLVTKAVNEAPEYAELRVVAKARVLAELVKANHQERAVFRQSGCDDGQACHRLLTDAERPIAALYESYVASLRDGELRATQTLTRGNQRVTRTVFYGGVDWSAASLERLDDAAVVAARPELPDELTAALAGMGPVSRAGGATVAGGILTDAARAQPVPPPDAAALAADHPADPSATTGETRRRFPLLPVLGLATVVVAVWGTARRRRWR